MSLSLDQARAMVAAFEAAELALAQGKSYRIGKRELTRADENWVSERLAFYRARVAQLSGQTRRARRFVPFD